MKHRWKKGLTLREIAEQEDRIADLARAGRGKYAPLLPDGKEWTPTVERIDDAQREAIHLRLHSRSLIVGVTGYPGSGKTTAIQQAALALKELTGQSPVCLAPTGSTAEKLKQAAGPRDACSIELFKTDPRLQQLARGRDIWIDEASLMNNDDAEWLLDFAWKNRSQIMCWGDPKQEHSVGRGDPYRDLLQLGLMKNVFLDQIHRQKNEYLKETIKVWHRGEHVVAFDRLEEGNLFMEHESYEAARKVTVDLAVERRKEGKKPMVTALFHRHGSELCAEIRSQLKADGIVGGEERIHSRLNKLHLSDAQRRDWVHYEAGQVIECHKATPGLRARVQYKVSRVDAENVYVKSANGTEAQVPLEHADRFNVYRVEAMRMSPGDQVLFTRNDSANDICNGQLDTFKEWKGNRLVFESGRSISADEPMHIRQGYTITSMSSQSHDASANIAFMPAEAAAAMNAEQMLVTISRPIDELLVVTDSIAVVRQCTTQSDERESAREFIGLEHVEGQETDLQYAKTLYEKSQVSNKKGYSYDDYGHDNHVQHQEPSRDYAHEQGMER